MFWVLSLLATTSKIQIISRSVTHKHVCFYAHPARIMSRNSLQVCIQKFIRIILFIFICSMSTKVICQCERSLIRNHVSPILASRVSVQYLIADQHMGTHLFCMMNAHDKTTKIFSNSFFFQTKRCASLCVCVSVPQVCVVILTFRKLK